jgi:hypothetical protein
MLLKASIGGTSEVNMKYTKGYPQEEEEKKWRKRYTVQVLNF